MPSWLGISWRCTLMVAIVAISGCDPQADTHHSDPGTATPPATSTAGQSTEATGSPVPGSARPVFVDNAAAAAVEMPILPEPGLGEARLMLAGGWRADVVLGGGELTCTGGPFDDPSKGSSWTYRAHARDNIVTFTVEIAATPRSMRSRFPLAPQISIRFTDDRHNLQTIHATKDSADDIEVAVSEDRRSLALKATATVLPGDFGDPDDRVSKVAVNATFSCGLIAPR
ncbi:hypothetical protein ACIO52_02940 [Nocardia sp. NPDC087230]|uniref:hypothetical protein n=1 Tax=Nocardia sp. NPDC087230 TaxID=3364331 RepID=UPI0037FB839C